MYNCYIKMNKKTVNSMDIIQLKDFSAIKGYTQALMAMDKWIKERPCFYLIREHYLVEQAIRLEYIIIQ